MTTNCLKIDRNGEAYQRFLKASPFFKVLLYRLSFLHVLSEQLLLGVASAMIILVSWTDNTGFDVVWCQWCLSYMADTDLVVYLKRSQRALRKGSVMKEKVCEDGEGGVPEKRLNPVDSSVTRYLYRLHYLVI